MNYVPSSMWQNRLDRQFDLTGVGNASLSAAYNAKMYAVRLEKLQQLLRTADLRHKSVLEIGCGTGFYTAWFAEQGIGSYTGIDIAQVSIDRLASQYPHFEFIVADIAQTAPRAASYDYVFIADVLFHIVDEADFRYAMAHLCQALKPGGSLILSDMLAEYDVQVARHVRFRSSTTYEQVLAASGVRVQQIRPIFGLLHPLAFVSGVSFAWQLATFIWTYGLLRFGRKKWFTPTFGCLFGRIDRILLRNPSNKIPNLKWLLATK